MVLTPKFISTRVSQALGPIAQLVERYTGSVEVSGSTPLRSISPVRCIGRGAIAPHDRFRSRKLAFPSILSLFSVIYLSTWYF